MSLLELSSPSHTELQWKRQRLDLAAPFTGYVQTPLLVGGMHDMSKPGWVARTLGRSERLCKKHARLASAVLPGVPISLAAIHLTLWPALVHATHQPLSGLTTSIMAQGTS